MTNALTTIERARGFLDAATLSQEWIQRMADRAMVREAHHTTHIEGTHLTLEESERLLAGEAVPGADPDDTRELLNYRDAFAFVSEYLNDGGPVSEGLIREIHKWLVEGVRGGTAHPGEYRAVQNLVVNAATGATVYTPPPPGDVPDLMQDLVKWLNAPSDIHPVLMSGIAQFQLVHIHPFIDGNGRTSRLLSTLCLYRTGYDFKHLFSISEFYDRDRAAFYAAIQGVRDNGMDLTGWLDYFTTGLATQMDEVKERGTKVLKADLIAREYGLSDRQMTALMHLMEHDRLTIKDFAQHCPSVSSRTLQRDIDGLVKAGLVHASGRARQSHYALTDKML
ncbi:MAG: Fic family protein [Spartobacteria bacterium]|nr:Fic family protein [Spartobacteria bacterium]